MNTCDLCARDAMKVYDEINDKSEAYDEYVAKRCDEIIANDEHCINLNRKILKLEQELLPLLPHEALNKFLKIDELNMELVNRICTLLYR